MVKVKNIVKHGIPKNYLFINSDIKLVRSVKEITRGYKRVLINTIITLYKNRSLQTVIKYIINKQLLVSHIKTKIFK